MHFILSAPRQVEGLIQQVSCCCPAHTPAVLPVHQRYCSSHSRRQKELCITSCLRTDRMEASLSRLARSAPE